MIIHLLLPWFPILLAAGLGGRLLGRFRAFALGLLCALFWIAMVQSAYGGAVWLNNWAAITMLAGCMAIIVVAGWAGESSDIEGDTKENAASGNQTQYAGSELQRSYESQLHRGREPLKKHGISEERGILNERGFQKGHESKSALERIAEIFDQFEDWLEEHREERNPWPKFDELIRLALYRCCSATHVRPYRLVADSEELRPLRDHDPMTLTEPLSARTGVIGQVVTTGRSYLADDPNQGKLVARLADQEGGPIAWAFPITRNAVRLGVVTVRHLEIPATENKELLRTMERLINRMWCAVAESLELQSAATYDPACGFYTRESFFRVAEASLTGSYRLGEPVAVVVFAFERLRELNDAGRWEVADTLIWTASEALRAKLRTDDELGRFDESRFVVLLRRVDSQLATLIVEQVMEQLKTICGDKQRWQARVDVRCGLVGSGTSHPDLRTLISGALTQNRIAREQDKDISTDLPERSLVGATS